jgi:hypothetical protein
MIGAGKCSLSIGKINAIVSAGERRYLDTITYLRGGQLFYARRADGESPIAAVARSVARRYGEGVTLWWSECRYGHDVYTAKWLDVATDTYQETEVIL